MTNHDSSNSTTSETAANTETLAFYFPNYHRDPRNETRYGQGWTEWELVRAARPRFAGHAQPKIPAWGYEDEADPKVFSKKIDAAADYGISGFLFDWYAYDDGYFLNRALDEGFLTADNVHRLKFVLMWANHDWVDIFPDTVGKIPELHYDGAVTRATFEAFTDDVIERYFKHPSYLCVDGRPFFSIFSTYRFVQGLGGLEAAMDALKTFRQKTMEAGFAGLHVNAILSGLTLPDATVQAALKLNGANDLARTLELDSVMPYVWLKHFDQAQSFPTCDYLETLAREVQGWHEVAAEFKIDSFPNVTVGWDATPRCDPHYPFEFGEYPHVPVLGDNTPEAFKTALETAKAFVEGRPGPRIVSLNAWNEWTEGSYLEPDTTHGNAYLEAVRAVFGGERS